MRRALGSLMIGLVLAGALIASACGTAGGAAGHPGQTSPTPGGAAIRDLFCLARSVRNAAVDRASVAPAAQDSLARHCRG